MTSPVLGGRQRRIAVYSHDGYGLGNIRRTLSIAADLAARLPDSSVVVLTGSPLVHSFRLSAGVDYVKLPCLRRDAEGTYRAKYWAMEVAELTEMRTRLIDSVLRVFRPDALLVDRKPYGMQDELRPLLRAPYLSDTRRVLVLRDILDERASTRRNWRERGYYDAVERHYDRVLVMGEREVFDVVDEYAFPAAVAQKVSFCGYLERGDRDPGGADRFAVQALRLGIQPGDRLVLVTPGGGEDGAPLLDAVLAALPLLADVPRLKFLLVHGPELPAASRQALQAGITAHPGVIAREFVDRMEDLFWGAELVVSMAGYNTVCEILSHRKRAIVVPRTVPSREQLVRARRLADLGVLRTIEPEVLSGRAMAEAIRAALAVDAPAGVAQFDLTALPRIGAAVRALLGLPEVPDAVPDSAGLASAAEALA